jgi:hypothetical protein
MKTKENCKKWKAVSCWELLRYNGVCSICFTNEINRKKRKPLL